MIELHVLQFGSQCLPINQIVVYLVYSNNLNSYIAIHEIYRILPYPHNALIHLKLSIVSLDAMLEFEEEDVAWATYHECPIKNQIHLTHRQVS